MTDLVIGERYEILEEIGKGGMAIVYKARCKVLNRYVALKVLRPEFRGDAEFVERFKIEAQSAGGLSHPNIVSVYDVMQSDGLNYIVMEYVEGITLKQYIATKGVLPWKEAVDYAAQICAGLEHAHKKGIVHRDIKPQNIIITREGTAKITDFGIAKATNAATIEMGATNMGSVHYFSPEQARGSYVDLKTDIYSLGVMLYEMVTGKVPFDGDNLVTIAMQHLETVPVAPTKLNPEIPESLENIIGKAMCKEKSGRYDDVTKMLIDLKKVYIGTPVSHSTEDAGDTVFIPSIVRDRNPAEKEFEDAENAPKKQNRGEISIPIEQGGKKNKKKTSSKDDKMSVIFGVITGLILIGLFSFVFYQFFLGGGVEEIELPDFTGSTVSEATELIKETKLKIEVKTEEKSDEFDVGEIISQDPEAGKKVKENATVKVVISLGGNESKMPDLKDMSSDDAKKLLSSLNIKYDTALEESSTVSEGYVVRQYPSYGTSMKQTDTATIYISSGEAVRLAKVPTLIGMTESAAKNTLENAGLALGKVYTEESEKPEGTVSKQSLRADIQVAEGTLVDIIISKGKATPTAKPTDTPTENDTPTKAPITPVPNTLE